MKFQEGSGGVVAVAFPSYSPDTSNRRGVSKRRADDFGGLRNLGESVLIAKSTFGFVMPVEKAHSFLSDITKYGGKILKFHESSKSEDQQGIEAAKGASKSTDDGTPSSAPPASKASAPKYDKTKIKEGTWIDIPEGLNAYRIAMVGTHALFYVEGGMVKGTLEAGKYYVLGVDRQNGVATISPTEKLGEAVFNIDLDELFAEASPKVKDDGTSFSSPKAAKVKAKEYKKVKPVGESVKAACPRCGALVESDFKFCPSCGGSMKEGYKGVKKLPKAGQKKKEGIGVIGAIAGTAQTPVRESTSPPAAKVTVESVHARGLKVLQTLRAKDSNLEPKNLSTGESGLAILEAKQKADSPPSAEGTQRVHHEGQPTPTPLSNDFNKNFGLPDLNPDLKSRLMSLRQGVTNPANMLLDKTGQELLEKAQDFQAMGDVKEVDIEDPEKDEASTAGIVSYLKKQGYANPEKVAKAWASGMPAEEFVQFTGGSVQDAKRLKWHLDKRLGDPSLGT